MTRERRWLVYVIIVVLVITTTALLYQVIQNRRGTATTGPDDGVAHVHGLGVDPADGTLYAATHTGLFRIPAKGNAERVANRYQDTMGFTVAGPRHFFGSGHPDLRERRPSRLGLIESTDAGETWQSISLEGRADFHGLAFVADRVYGYDSTEGQFMVSTDRVNWDVRSKLDLVAFAVDPSDPEHLIGSSDAGLLASADGGRSWQRIAGPRLVTLSWQAGASLWGADNARLLSRSNDGGRSWQSVAQLPGTPHVLLATGQTLYAAVEDTIGAAIYVSEDSGRNWKVRYRDRARDE